MSEFELLELHAIDDSLTESDVAFIIARFTKHGIVPSNNQAMALVKKFQLDIRAPCDGAPKWDAWYALAEEHHFAAHLDLNCAICECCAKMWLSSSGATNGNATDKDN